VKIMTQGIYILLGSNLGDREKSLAKALGRIEGIEGLELVAASSVYISEAQDMQGENPSFLNQVIKADYDYSPGELLSALENIEIELGRTDKGKKSPRTIDLDILLFDDRTMETERLTIPHSELLNRPFAMVPLLQIDPDLIHPGTGKQVSEYLNDESQTEVILYKDYVARTV